MAIIKTEHLVHNYTITTSTMDTNTIHVLKDIDFEVEKGEFVSIMGRSGCGKSTFLKLLGMIEHGRSVERRISRYQKTTDWFGLPGFLSSGQLMYQRQHSPANDP